MVPYRKVFEELEKQKIHYLIAGGFAVNFHQVQRATVDLDLILHLKKENILRFVKLAKRLGFVPRLPVKAEELAEETKRKEWIATKGMMVFSFINPRNPLEVIDVFTQEPIPFNALWSRRLEVDAFGSKLKVLGKTDLIALKKKAGREKDKFDIQQLEKKS